MPMKPNWMLMVGMTDDGFFWPIKSVNTNIKAATLVAATAFLVSCGTPHACPRM